MPIKIVVCTYGDIFSNDGTSVRVWRVINLIKEKYIVKVIAFLKNKAPKQLVKFDIKVITFNTGNENLPLQRGDFFNFFYYIMLNFKICWIFVKEDFNIIYCPENWVCFPGLFLISKLRGRKIIFEAHGILSEQFKEKGNTGLSLFIRKIWEKAIIKQSDCVIALSPNIYDFYKQFNRNIYTIPVFIEDELFRTEINKVHKVTKIVGLIGPFNTPYNKGFLDFLRENIDEFEDYIHFHIIGLCEEKFVSKKIIYLGYLSSQKEYIRSLCSLDAVLVPSIIATSGPLNKIVEPMACGVPVFTTPKGLVGLYWVEPERDIFVFEKSEIVKKVNELIIDDELMQRTGENARKVVEQYYSKKVNKRRLIQIIEEIAGN